MEIKAKLTGNLDDVAKRFSSMQLFSVSKAKDAVRLLKVESRDIQKRPYLFMIIELRPDRVALSYTLAVDASPKLRCLYVLRTALSVLSMIPDLYVVDDVELFQHLDSAIDDVLGSITQSYSSLFNNYDALFNEYKEMKRLNVELEASNKNLTVQALQLDDENKQFRSDLNELQGYSDKSLMVMVQEWLEAHEDSIDINGFAKYYKLSPTRVEQILNRMVSLGYIELKG